MEEARFRRHALVLDNTIAMLLSLNTNKPVTVKDKSAGFNFHPTFNIMRL